MLFTTVTWGVALLIIGLYVTAQNPSDVASSNLFKQNCLFYDNKINFLTNHILEQLVAVGNRIYLSRSYQSLQTWKYFFIDINTFTFLQSAVHHIVKE